jgi:propionaldehyde dehydrogenase
VSILADLYNKNEEVLVIDIARRVAEALNSLSTNVETGIGFDDVNQAAMTVAKAQRAWQWDYSLESRIRILNGLKSELMNDEILKELCDMVVEETGMGRADDKIIKKRLSIEKTPGPEYFKVNAVTGDHGIAIEELSPFGVIASITPSTNPVSSVFNNTICMLAGGNGVVFAPHPGAIKCTLKAIEYVSNALVKYGAPKGIVVTLTNPTLDNLEKLMSHESIKLISATGGPGVVNAALRSGKPAIGAGPGNPPVLVDETADISKAAADIIMGCSFDNNLPCIAEKELFVVNCVADTLKKYMIESGLAFELKDKKDIDALMCATLAEVGPNKKMVGKSAQYLLEHIGIKIPQKVRVILVETEENHPFVQEEMLMPILPLVRVADFEAGLAASIRAEHGFRHSAIMHSTNINNMSVMARAMETTVFIKNASSFSSIGYNGDCPTAFTIATTTGQGPTTPLSFCRLRRCVLNGAFRIV